MTYRFKGCILELNRMSNRPWPVWVIDSHYVDHSRSSLGEMVYTAKYHHSESVCCELESVVRVASRWASKVPPRHQLQSLDAVIAVPYFGERALSVPHRMAKAISKELGVIDLSEKVKKLTPTKMKHEEPEVSPGIYQVEALGKLGQVLLVDDLYRSGATLESVAVQLRSHAVREVIGFCATKVRAGLRDRGD